jgi:YspA, cpYpsA-related SLOG family
MALSVYRLDTTSQTVGSNFQYLISNSYIQDGVNHARNILRNMKRGSAMQIAEDEDMLCVAITGGRYYNDIDKLNKVLNQYKSKELILILGDATGADALARAWAEHNKVPYIMNRANWKKHGKAAGPLRNTEMLKKSHLLVAFPGGKGTQNCISQAKARGIEVREV